MFVFVCCVCFFISYRCLNVCVDLQPLRDTEDERLMCEVEFFLGGVYLWKVRRICINVTS